MKPHTEWLELALKCAHQSKDPSTQVGAVLVGATDTPVALGFNRFPFGVKVTPRRLRNRELKLRFMLHAERVAMLSALRAGEPLAECTLYLAATDSTGQVWGGPPCSNCMIELVEAGLRKVVSYPQKFPSKWADDLANSREIMSEAGVGFIEMLP
jgi:dCMP deaminase